MFIGNYNKIINSKNPAAYFIESKDRENWYIFDYEIKHAQTEIYWIDNIKVALLFATKDDAYNFIEHLNIAKRNIKIKYVQNIREI